MDPVRNPYSPGAGAAPPALVGRDAEIAAFDVAVRRLALGRSARSVVLTGLRGVGKTVLLGEFGRIAERHGWMHQPVEAAEDLPFAEAVGTLVRRTLLRLSPGGAAADRVRHALGVLKSFQLRWKLPEGGDVSVGLDPVPGPADSGLLDADLAGLFTEVGDAARDRGAGVLITIDELQYLPREHLGALMVGLHRVSQEQAPILVAAAGLPSVPGLLGAAKSYAERLFAFTVINSLAAEDARAALVAPARAEGVEWPADALERILTATRGYPYFLQEFGKHAWNLADGPDEITAADVEAALPVALDELDAGFFRVRIDRATAAERACLVAMAALGGGPYRCDDVEAAGGGPTAAGDALSALVSHGICYTPRHGEVDFTVPRFDRFVRRRLA